MDQSILADFLIEAGELLARLGEQLVALEARPTDTELLNAVFRAYHTVKGGAGFLAVEPMVALCHSAEDLLSKARAGRVVLDGNAMDALLASLDTLQAMTLSLAHDEMPASAAPALLARLDAAAQHSHGATVKNESPTFDPIEEEFEAVLAAARAETSAPSAKPSDPISDDEFEALLDAMQAQPAATEAKPRETEYVPVVVANAAPAAKPTPTAKPTPPSTIGETTIRVDTGRLDALVNFIGELVLVRNRLGNLTANGEDDRIERAVGELDRVTNDLQSAVLRTRMQPVGRLFARFPRIARDLARQLGKEIELVLEGEDTDLDRNLVEALADPLVHLVRNAVDHGVETPAERERSRKPRAGRVRLAASQEGDQIVISVSDDGRGMNPDVLRRKAIERGILDAEHAARLSDEECFEIIFLPGFSTCSEVSDISGRGVGMDVVKTRVVELGGTLAVHSKAGIGSEIRVHVPLTLAILRALMVRVRGRMLALPLANVAEVFELDESGVRRVDGREVIPHRGRPLPLARLEDWLGGDALGERGRQHVAVVQLGHQRVGCVVHDVAGREEVVIKPLGALLRDVSGVAGATITGDGRIALIVDLVGLIRATEALAPRHDRAIA